jgi:hypothetical protein
MTVPTANPTLVTIDCESADYRCDEGLLQLDLVRSGRRVPVAGWRCKLIGLYRLAPKVLEALKIIAPETVIRWHRAGFRAYWRCKSRPLGRLDRDPIAC